MQPAVPIGRLALLLKDVIEGSELFWDLWVEGEVSNFSASRLGHRYFSLRDETGMLRAVLFRDDMPGEMLKDGDDVLAHGRVTVYPQRGELQFVCDFARPRGIGLAAARFEELAARLEAEGLFAPERKRPLPSFPRRIGVVTSPSSAAWQDIQRVAAERWPLATLVLAPAVVQGDRAPVHIVEALNDLARDETIDVAIVARGGGSKEDLWAFNDEGVVRAIYRFPKPVVTGVGHENDTTIADLVADRVGSTPSAATAMATPDRLEHIARATERGHSMTAHLGAHLRGAAAQVDTMSRRLQQAAPDPVPLTRELQVTGLRLASAFERTAAARRGRLDEAAARFGSLDPAATLRRGYAVVQRAQSGKVVTSVRRVKSGDRLAIAVSDGAFFTEVS